MIPPGPAFESFDAFLSASDSESMDWNEFEYQLAQELLAKFTSDDFARLEREWKTRDKEWRLCLESALCPKQSEAEGRLLLEMAHDVDVDVRYSALHHITFYCGVIGIGGGHYQFDEAYRPPEFFERAKEGGRLLQVLREEIDARAPFVFEGWEMLAKMLAKMLAE